MGLEKKETCKEEHGKSSRVRKISHCQKKKRTSSGLQKRHLEVVEEEKRGKSTVPLISLL
jgi:hypothetical protein